MRLSTWLVTLASLASAVNVTFRNCLADNVVSPRFNPILVNADFDSTTHIMSYLVSGDMIGQVNDTNAANTLASAVTDTISVAGYQARKVDRRLCDVSRDTLLGNASACPFGPGKVLFAFDVPLNASFIFASITSTIRINGPTETNFTVGCLEVTTTPPFSSAINNVLTYIPLAILAMVGIKVVVVALGNPWSGTLDPYRAFSNFGMDANALRLSTPGFSDCLMYLQFVAYSSMLRLNYPGFYQLATSRIAWSMLLFDRSPVSSPLSYTPPQSSSIATYINFVGARRQDAWKSFIVWWVILLACTVALVAVIVGIWWFLTSSSTDISRRNLPFLGGCMVRIYYWMLLPLSLFTSYQLVTAQQSLAALTALSALILMLLIILCPLALIWFLPRYRPRQDLYEDLAFLSLFGPLYNTFAEHATLMFIPNVVLTIFRGLTIGFLTQHGIAQLVLLLIFEAASMTLLILNRPWPRSTNTNIFAVVLNGIRILVLVFMILFVSNLHLSSGKTEWLGYLILVIHAAVLVILFLGNALLALLELAIRLFVIVPQDEGARAIFGARQLKSRRGKRRHVDADDHAVSTVISANSLANLLSGKEESPFFRTPRNPSRLSSRIGAESSLGDFRSISGSEFTSPIQDTTYHGAFHNRKMSVVRSPSYASEDLLHAIKSEPDYTDPPAPDNSYNLFDLSLQATADAARRGVDYAIREADIYHPQSSGELLGPSKKLGTGPADPNGVKFRKFSWIPWKKERNEERGKFVVIRSAPAPEKAVNVPLRELDGHSPDSVDAARNSPPQHSYDETHGEEEEDEDEQDVTVFGQVRMNSPSRGQIVAGQSPILPRFEQSSTLFSPFGSSMLEEDHAFLHSPTDHGVRRRDSDESDTSVVSVLMSPTRPVPGERVASYHSGHTERSVRSSLVRDSYVSTRTGPSGETAELVDLTPDATKESH